MAYVLASEVAATTASATSLEVQIPSGYVAGDLLIVIGQQDGGSGTFSAPSGWTSCFSSAQALMNGQRTYAWYKIAASDSEDAFILSSSLNEDLNAVSLVIRGADTTNPIDVGSISANNNNILVLPGITTSQPNSLLIRGHGNDTSTTRHKFIGTNLVKVAYSVGFHVQLAVGYSYSNEDGTSPDASLLRFATTTGGASFVIAIRGASQSARLPVCGSYPQIMRHYGVAALSQDPTAVTQHPPSAFASTYVGYAADTNTAATSGTKDNPTPNDAGDAFTTIISTTVTNSQTIMVGAITEWASSMDFSDGLLTASITIDGASTATRDLYFFLGDSDGAWSLFYVTPYAGIRVDEIYNPIIDINTVDRVDGSGVLNTANITKFGLLWLRNTGTLTSPTPRGYAIRNLAKITKSSQVILGGYGVPEVKFTQSLKNVLDQMPLGLATIQATSQILLRSSIVLGNGIKTSHFDLKGIALEAPAPYTKTLARRFNMFGAAVPEIRVKLSPSDSINLTGAVLSAAIPYTFVVDAASSPSATYVFQGLTLNGFSAEFNAPDVPVDGLLFLNTRKVTSLAQVTNCTFNGPVDLVGLVVPNASLVSFCSFEQGTNGGHAIEITQPGSYSFVGNTFEGYGLDGTTDAAIYNNSGGQVTLNVSRGGDTPTIRNGIGATTDVVSGAQVSVIGLATGSQVKVVKVSNGDVLFNGAESGGQINFSTTFIGAIRVEARKASSSPYYKPWATQANTISGQTVEITALQELDE